MSRGDLPQYENGYELIVISRGADYIAAGKYRGNFGGYGAYYHLPKDMEMSAATLRPMSDANAPVRFQREIFELVQVELYELVDHGGVRSFRGWIIKPRDEATMVEQRRFTAILGGQRYEGATQHVAVTQTNEITNMVHGIGQHLNIELVSFMDVQYDRLVIGISGEKQPLLYLHRGQMQRLSNTQERARYIINVIEQALEERGEITRRKVNLQPVAEPEVVVAQLVGHTRKLNLGD